MTVTVDGRVARSATVRERGTVSLETVWVLGDQLDHAGSALAAASPATHRALMVESLGKLQSKRWHMQCADFVIASMRRFAGELRNAGSRSTTAGRRRSPGQPFRLPLRKPSRSRVT